jgi:AcrR family transcriptional regulator
MHDNEQRDGSVLTTGRLRPSRADGKKEVAETIGNRERAMSAFVTRVATTGYRQTHVEDVCRDVGASTRDFYAWFGKKDRCYLTVFAAFGNYVITQAERAYNGVPGPWETRLRLALEAAFDELTARPKMVRFLGQSSQVDGSRAVLLSMIERSRPLYFPEEVRQQVDDVPREPLEIIASSSIVYPIVMYVREGKLQDISELIPSILYHLSLVFFGPERAARQCQPLASAPARTDGTTAAV